MAYTEKVSISGTALSFLLYECVNSVNSQEGFLIGDVTSEITNHISDSQSDNARLDTQIVIRTVLPLPSISLFYLPTGKIREDVLSDILSTSAYEVVGWYKFRKNNTMKPTFRDKLISKGLQKYFEKQHFKKTFVTCIVTNRTSFVSSTHTFTYRFGKINCFDMYEYIDDVTANLGEKLTAYKKPCKQSPNCIFNKIVQKSNVQGNNTSEAILHIQQAVDVRLVEEAKLAARNECKIRDLEAEIKLMSNILSEKQAVGLQEKQNKIIKEKLDQRKIEMAAACVEALKEQSKMPNLPTLNNHTEEPNDKIDYRILNNSSPVKKVTSIKPVGLNYASALKSNLESPSTSKVDNLTVDLITFDDEENNPQKTVKENKPIAKDDIDCSGDNSPDY